MTTLVGYEDVQIRPYRGTPATDFDDYDPNLISDVLDRDGRRVGSFVTGNWWETEGSAPDSLRGVIRVGYGDTLGVPLANNSHSGSDFVVVEGPSRWSALGIFALGWAGGYLAWVGIGKYQQRQEAQRSEMVYQKMNRKVPYVSPPEKKNWQR